MLSADAVIRAQSMGQLRARRVANMVQQGPGAALYVFRVVPGLTRSCEKGPLCRGLGLGCVCVEGTQPEPPGGRLRVRPWGLGAIRPSHM
jgi:hypothetical protein